MSFDLVKANLGDFLNFKNGKKSPERSDDSTYPVFGSNGLIGRSEETNCSANTIVIGRVGSYCGSVHFSKHKCWVSDNAISCSVKNPGEENFWFYVLERLNLNQFSSGSGQPLLNQATLNSVECMVPNNSDLRINIGHVLSDYDKKITLNTKTNQTLEAMAQTIFKSWFVDFDPVKAKMNGEQPEGMNEATASLFAEKLVESELGLIPEGWDESALYDIAEYINGAAYKKFEPNGEGLGLPIVKIAELKSGISDKTGFSTVQMPEKYRLDDKDILFSWSGNPDTSIDTFVWALGEAWLNQHIFKVVPKSGVSRSYVLSLLKFMRPVFAEIARDKQTTGLGHVTVKDLQRLKVALPPEKLLIKFNEKVDVILAQNFNLVKQSQTLEKLRDTLLPKLLSGEIGLEEIRSQDGI